MIRAVANLEDGGVLVMLGITEGNVERLKKGQPIDVNLGAMLVEASRDAEPMRGALRLAISYKPTHVEIVKEWLEAGVPIDEDMLDAAAQIDASM